jgi:hypothetical protein
VWQVHEEAQKSARSKAGNLILQMYGIHLHLQISHMALVLSNTDVFSGCAPVSSLPAGFKPLNGS